MVWHLHIGSKLRFLDPPEVLSKIWANLVKKFKPPEQPLLEVRRFFKWCQGMSLGILKRFREKNAQFFFCDFNFGWKIQRLLLIIILHGFQIFNALQATALLNWNICWIMVYCLLSWIVMVPLTPAHLWLSECPSSAELIFTWVSVESLYSPEIG